jgi:hypothetical protein
VSNYDPFNEFQNKTTSCNTLIRIEIFSVCQGGIELYFEYIFDNLY